MIIYMSDIICVTNRKLCTVPFLSQIENIAKAGPKAIILREKDMEEEEYYNIAKEVKEICEKYDVELIIHSFYNVALKLGIGSLHMPLGLLESISTDDKKKFTNIGASCHSKKDAVKAYSLGCTYIIAGHIFETDCKKGLPGRGISFLKNRRNYLMSLYPDVFIFPSIVISGSDFFLSVERSSSSLLCIIL